MPVMQTHYELEAWIDDAGDWQRIPRAAASYDTLAEAVEVARRQADSAGGPWRVIRVDEAPICEIRPGEGVDSTPEKTDK